MTSAPSTCVETLFKHKGLVDDHGLVNKNDLRCLLELVVPQLLDDDIDALLGLGTNDQGGVELRSWIGAIFAEQAQVQDECNYLTTLQSAGGFNGVVAANATCRVSAERAFDDADCHVASAVVANLPTPSRSRPTTSDAPVSKHDVACPFDETCVPIPIEADLPVANVCASFPPCANQIFECPWHEAVLQFVSLQGMLQLSAVSATLRALITVEDTSGCCRHVLPIVELHKESAEATLRYVSTAHIRTLRVWHRSSLDTFADVARTCAPRACQSLERLAIKGCPLGYEDFHLILAPVFAQVGGLLHLNLERNQVDNEMIQHFVDSGAFAAARLESLNLRFNRIGAEGVTALAKCTNATQRLKWLNLKMNRIGDEGALALAGMIKTSPVLSLLNLRRQSPALTDEAAVGLADAFRFSNVFEQLRLRRNRIGDKGAAALGAAVRERLVHWHMSSCIEVDIEENRVGKGGALSLLRALAGIPSTNRRVEILLHGNPISREALRSAVLNVSASADAALDADDHRISFQSKPESTL